MRLAPDNTELLARARADLRMGVPIAIKGLNSCDLVISAETLGPERLVTLRALGGTLALAITARRAHTLKAVPYDGDVARILIPNHADITWIQSVADPADDLRTPLKGPFAADRRGSAQSHRLAIDLAKSAQLLPAAVVVSGADFSEIEGLTTLEASATAQILQDQVTLTGVVNARLPLTVSEAGRLHIWRPDDGSEEHYAVEIGAPDRNAPVLTRLHSACLTGDLMGSLKCDCGPQLRGALAQMGHEGAGVLLYLNQEGRGIGLANKMRAYALQDQGFDTVEANHRLGFEDDERDFRIGAAILRSMGFKSVRLLTNNPAKIEMMRTHGIDVTERVPLQVGENVHNENYLATKAKKSGHLL